jgi:hypothetical protein
VLQRKVQNRWLLRMAPHACLLPAMPCEWRGGTPGLQGFKSCHPLPARGNDRAAFRGHQGCVCANLCKGAFQGVRCRGLLLQVDHPGTECVLGIVHVRHHAGFVDPRHLKKLGVLSTRPTRGDPLYCTPKREKVPVGVSLRRTFAAVCRHSRGIWLGVEVEAGEAGEQGWRRDSLWIIPMVWVQRRGMDRTDPAAARPWVRIRQGLGAERRCFLREDLAPPGASRTTAAAVVGGWFLRLDW